MGQLTLVEICACIGMLTVIGGFFTFLFKLWSRFTKLERQGLYRQEDTAMIFECLRGCLEGAIQNGANGEVKGALRKLNSYTDNKAAGLMGDGSQRSN